MTQSRAARWQRAAAEIAIGVSALAGVTAMAVALGLRAATVALFYLIVIDLLALRAGFGALALLSFVAVGCLNVFFVPPTYAFTLQPIDAVEAAIAKALTEKPVRKPAPKESSPAKAPPPKPAAKPAAKKARPPARKPAPTVKAKSGATKPKKPAARGKGRAPARKAAAKPARGRVPARGKAATRKSKR